LIADAEIELCVLSAMMQRTNTIAELTDMGVSGATFSTERNERLYAAIVELNTKQNVDVVDPLMLHRSVQLSMPEMSLTDITKLFGYTASSYNIQHHAQTLLDLQTRRKLELLGQQLTKQAADLAVDAQNAISQIEQQLLSDSADSGLISMEAAVGQTHAWAKKNHGAEIIGLSSGYRKLDELTYGLQPGQLIILAARPSKGKSALAWQIAYHVGLDHPVAYFSLEMDARSLVLRSLAQNTGLTINDLQRHRIPQQAADTYAYALRELRTRQIHVDQRGTITVATLRSRAKQMARLHGLSLVVVDYLQLMSGHGTNREQEVSHISRGLKALAMDLQVPVLACAQLNRTIEGRAGEMSRPTLSDLRDSGQIEQDADVVGMLWWGFEHLPDFNHGEVELLIRKNRQGALGTVPLKWQPDWVKFDERI